MNVKKIVLAGGTGFLGNAIIQKLNDGKTEIVVLTRGVARQKNKVNYLQWDGETLGKWAEEIDGADVVINLTGKSVDCRYSEKNKKEIISSRVNATKILGEAIVRSKNPPALWLNSASATIYRYAEDKPMDEFTGEIGDGFSVGVCKIWEKTFNEISTPETRKVVMRISLVLGKEGGLLPVMKNLVKKGLGGKMGTGNQYVSWIHEDDYLNALVWLIEHPEASGPYNMAAPEPVPNNEFMRLMRTTLGKNVGLPARKWMLEVGAFFMRTETELILKRRSVIPS